MACTIVDVLARRTRLAFLNATAAYDALPKIGKIMQKEFQWDANQLEQQMAEAKEFLNSMGWRPSTAESVPPEMHKLFTSTFSAVDSSGSGSITLSQVVDALDRLSYEYDVDSLRDAFNTYSFNSENPTIEFSEFVEFALAAKKGKLSVVQPTQTQRARIDTERSGGGV